MRYRLFMALGVLRHMPDFYGAQELFSLLKKRMGAEIVS